MAKHPSKFEDLIPDREVLFRLNISPQTLWRFTYEPRYRDLAFPAVVKIGRRNFRSRRAIEAWLEKQTDGAGKGVVK
jgi:predicted DNA-binding transcriptional regulator AlpA